MYFEPTFDGLWHFFYTVLVLIYVWIFFSSIFIFKLVDMCEDWYICKWIRFLGETLLSVLGHICFMPIFSISLNIFLCDDGIGDELTSSYLSQDCRYFCYKGKHLLMSIIIAVSLILYLPTTIYCRPLWELLQPTLY